MSTAEQYQDLLKDPRWHDVRRKVLFRDKWTCQECGRQSTYPDFPTYKYGLILNVHHTKYIGDNPWDTPMQYLKTLCADCHNLEHCSPRTVELFKMFAKKISVNG